MIYLIYLSDGWKFYKVHQNPARSASTAKAGAMREHGEKIPLLTRKIQKSTAVDFSKAGAKLLRKRTVQWHLQQPEKNKLWIFRGQQAATHASYLMVKVLPLIPAGLPQADSPSLARTPSPSRQLQMKLNHG